MVSRDKPIVHFKEGLVNDNIEMNNDSRLDNKRIAKNSVMLYLRMFLMVGISMYTSRVILKVLGVTDYGIYNVVGSVVITFNFIMGAMQGSCQRYITFALGKGDMERLKMTFSVTRIVHCVLAVGLLLVGETIGLWMVQTQLVIPIDRVIAAQWVYQFSLLSACVSLISVPYNATIIAHERMSAFAYISILEALLKLVIVFVLTIFTFDRLILYGALMLAASVFIRFVYTIYCKRSFEETSNCWRWDRLLFKEIFAFAGWSLLPNLATTINAQGTNILLNIFFGPAVNAARGLSSFFQSVATQFTQNFQSAMNPQIVKSYSQENLSYMRVLLFRSSKFSFLLMLIIVLPLVVEAPYIFTLWLGEFPEHTVNFARIALIGMILGVPFNPFITANGATGIVKKYNIVIGAILLFECPIAYLVLKTGGTPELMMIILMLTVSIIANIARLLLVKEKIRMSAMLFLKDVLLPCGLVATLSLPLPLILHAILPVCFFSSVCVVLLSIIMIASLGFFIILKKNEKYFVINFIRTKILKK